MTMGMRLFASIGAMTLALIGCGDSSSSQPPTPSKTSSVSATNNQLSSATGGTSGSSSSGTTTTSSSSSATSQAITRKIEAVNEEITRKQDTLTIDQSEVASLLSIKNQSGIQSITATVATDPATLKNAGFWGFLDGLQKGNWQDVATADTAAATSAAKVAQAKQVQEQMQSKVDTLNQEISSLHTDIADLQTQLAALIKQQ